MPGYPTDRVIVYNRDATFAFELTPDEQRSRLRIEEINGEHSLTIQTTRRLSEGMRLVTQDDMGKWREHVVYKPDQGHHEGKYAIGTYLCMWSLQYDLTSAYAEEHAEPGMGSSCPSRNAVIAALDGQSLWTVGTCDVPAVSAGKGCVMIGVSDWERLSLVVEHWHGEIDAEIVMDETRVVSRKVNFLAHLGSSKVTRRFDWAEDLTSIDRHEDPGPYYCRVVPLGRGQREYAEDDETEFDWPLDISEETPDGRVYIEDSESAQVFRTKLPDGTWHYPTKVVTYDEDDPELLLNVAMADLHNHTRPSVSYEAEVLQFVRAGMDAKGVQLGDNTQCIDFGFNPDAALMVEGRVTRLEVEELAPETKTSLTIGDLAPTFAQTMKELVGRQTASISRRIKRIEGGGTIVYLQNLLDEFNAAINGTGGYSYFIDGEGIVTYDKLVTDPLIGSEATQVVQIKGGSIRIANSKKPAFSGINDWEWKTVFTSGHIAAELVTAANITAGFIGNATQGSYWDLDSGILYVSAGTTIEDALDDARKVATNYLSFTPADGLDVGYDGTSAKTRVNANGVEVFNGNGVSEAEFNGTQVRIGRTNKAHITIVPTSGIEMFDSVSSSILYIGRDANGFSMLRMGRSNVGGNIIMSAEGYVDIRNAQSTVAHFGHGATVSSGGGTVMAPYYDIGTRKSNSSIGERSVVMGAGCTASGSVSHAQGQETIATGAYSHAEGYKSSSTGYGSHAEGVETTATTQAAHAEGSETVASALGAHAEGRRTTASGSVSHAEGVDTVASGSYSHASGENTRAGYIHQFVCGRYNSNISGDLFEVGNGSLSGSYRSNAFRVDMTGAAYVGSTQVTSDRRVKTPLGEISDREAQDFIRSLKPSKFEKFGRRELGFYAQDVEETEFGEFLVSEANDHGYKDFKSLSYEGIIAPLVAYAQSLEKRIEDQDKTITAMQECLVALEVRMSEV